MSFCTPIKCMDGRIQLLVNEYLRRELAVDYVDTITEAGPVRILAEQQDSHTGQSILHRMEIFDWQTWLKVYRSRRSS